MTSLTKKRIQHVASLSIAYITGGIAATVRHYGPTWAGALCVAILAGLITFAIRSTEAKQK
jgi:hypothetical protein